MLGPANEVEYQKEDAARGKFAFTGKDSGTHKFCFTNGGQVGRRLSLDLKVGLEAKDYGEVARKEHLQPLEVRRTAGRGRKTRGSGCCGARAPHRVVSAASSPPRSSS